MTHRYKIAHNFTTHKFQIFSKIFKFFLSSSFWFFYSFCWISEKPLPRSINIEKHRQKGKNRRCLPKATMLQTTTTLQRSTKLQNQSEESALPSCSHHLHFVHSPGGFN